MKTQLTQEIAREHLSYNPSTGLFVWKKRDLDWWNTRYAGKPAFNSMHVVDC
jgi:hypothetical protein